ncbi:MAG: class I SAM-dependent RNA methyltransferase, partial [Oscillospiraceae bacterium]|nr:class I SAM-dependent RNA methyltransferase [Oscillospiraceae bacterium]
MTLEYNAPCLLGLEGIVAEELKRLGADNVRAENGHVRFAGDEHMLARANIGLRCAERVQLYVGGGRVATFDELFTLARALPWEQFIGRRDRFPVKGWSLDSALHSVPDCQAILKKAVAERLKAAYRVPWLEETGSLYQIQFTLLKDEVSLLIDTSGEGLHKRGWRKEAGGAPLKETLAAAIVDIARARTAPVVCDPCCGSGTLLIEAGLAAMKMAPGLHRRFAAMDFGWLPAAVWEEERQRARGFECPDRAPELRGGDTDAAVLAVARGNAAKAGVPLMVKTADV